MQDYRNNSQKISLSSDEKSLSFNNINLRDLSCATNLNRLCAEFGDNDDDDDDNNNTNIADNDTNRNNNNSLKFWIYFRVHSAA